MAGQQSGGRRSRLWIVVAGAGAQQLAQDAATNHTHTGVASWKSWKKWGRQNSISPNNQYNNCLRSIPVKYRCCLFVCLSVRRNVENKLALLWVEAGGSSDYFVIGLKHQIMTKSNQILHCPIYCQKVMKITEYWFKCHNCESPVRTLISLA